MTKFTKIFMGLFTLTFTLHASEIYATFTVEPEKKVMLAFQTNGIIQKVNYDIGDDVKKGALLASLRNADAEANLDSAKTTLKFTKKDYKRNLKVRNLIDEEKFDRYAFKYESAKNKLAFAQAQYDKTYLKSPVNAVIYERNIEVGDIVSGESLKTVFKLQSKSKRKLILKFDQKYHKLVKIGQYFRYNLDGDEKVYKGIITKVYPFSNSANRKITAEVKAKSFLVGLFGEGNIIIPDTK